MAEDLVGDTPAAWAVADFMAVGWEAAALVVVAWEAVAWEAVASAAQEGSVEVALAEVRQGLEARAVLGVSVRVDSVGPADSVVQVEGLAPVVTAGGCLEEWVLEVSLGSAALVAWARAGSVVLADRVAVVWVVVLLEGAICRAVDWALLACQTLLADEVQVSREVPAALLVERLRQVA